MAGTFGAATALMGVELRLAAVVVAALRWAVARFELRADEVLALRAATYLKRGGIALVNALRLPPPVVSLGLYRYPDDPLAELRAAGIRVHEIDAGGIARGLHDLRLVNTVMLGAAAGFLPFPAEALESLVIERFAVRKPALVVANRQAFAAGRIAAEKMPAGE